MKLWKINKEDGFFLWLILFGVALLFYVLLSNTIRSDNSKAEMDRIEQYYQTSTHSFFNIYYKDDSKVEEVECDECIYGQTDDKIYFVNNNKDTVKVVPKIEVQMVTTKDENKAK